MINGLKWSICDDVNESDDECKVLKRDVLNINFLRLTGSDYNVIYYIIVGFYKWGYVLKVLGIV